MANASTAAGAATAADAATTTDPAEEKRRIVWYASDAPDAKKKALGLYARPRALVYVC